MSYRSKHKTLQNIKLNTNSIDIVNRIVAGSQLLCENQIILGQKKHERRINKIYSVPEYAAKYGKNSNFVKVAVLIKGRCVIAVEDRTYALRAGDVIVIMPGTYHYESYFKSSIKYELVWFFYVKVDNLKINYTRYEKDSGLKFVSNINMKLNAKEYFVLEDIFTLEPGERNFQKMKIVVSRWFSFLGAKIEKGEFTYKMYSKEYLRDIKEKEVKLTKAIKYLENNYYNEISLEKLAKMSLLSKFHFSHVFNKANEMTFSEWITILRQNKACQLLLETNMRIKEVSYTVGYKDPLYFSRMFLKHKGLSPQNYRKRIATLSLG